MKNIWFSWRWDAGGPPEGSFWPFLRPPVRSWRDPEAFLPYLRDFHGFRALRTGWFPRFWAAVTAPRCSLGPLRARLGVGFCGPRPCFLSVILLSAGATANDLPSWDFNRRCRRTYPGVCRSGFFLGGLTCPSLLLFVATGPALLPRRGLLDVREVGHELFQFVVGFEFAHDPEVRQEAHQVCLPNCVAGTLPIFQELLYGDLVEAPGAVRPPDAEEVRYGLEARGVRGRQRGPFPLIGRKSFPGHGPSVAREGLYVEEGPPWAAPPIPGRVEGRRPSGSKPSPYGKNVSEPHSKNNRIVSTARRARVCRHVTPRAGDGPGLKHFREPICYVIKGDVRDVNE